MWYCEFTVSQNPQGKIVQWYIEVKISIQIHRQYILNTSIIFLSVKNCL